MTRGGHSCCPHLVKLEYISRSSDPKGYAASSLIVTDPPPPGQGKLDKDWIPFRSEGENWPFVKTNRKDTSTVGSGCADSLSNQMRLQRSLLLGLVVRRQRLKSFEG